MYVLAAYVVVSFTQFVVARFSPYEWYSKRAIALGTYGGGEEDEISQEESDIFPSYFTMLARSSICKRYQATQLYVSYSANCVYYYSTVISI